MGWLDRFNTIVATLKNEIDGEFAMYKHGDLPYALPAVAALIATADGLLAPEQIEDAAEAVFAPYDGLRYYHLGMLRLRFSDCCHHAQNTFERYEVQDLVARLKGRPEAVLAIRFGIVMALTGGSGGFKPGATVALDQICDLLGLDAEQVLPAAA